MKLRFLIACNLIFTALHSMEYKPSKMELDEPTAQETGMDIEELAPSILKKQRQPKSLTLLTGKDVIVDQVEDLDPDQTELLIKDYIDRLSRADDKEILKNKIIKKYPQYWKDLCYEEAEQVHELNARREFINDAMISKDGKNIFIIYGDEGLILFKSLATGKTIHTLNTHLNYIDYNQLSQEEDLLLLSGAIRTNSNPKRFVQVWNLERGELIISKEVPNLINCHLDGMHKNKAFLVFSDPGAIKTINIWDFITDTQSTLITDLSDLYNISFINDGKNIFIPRPHWATSHPRLYDANGKLLYEFDITTKNHCYLKLNPQETNCLFENVEFENTDLYFLNFQTGKAVYLANFPFVPWMSLTVNNLIAIRDEQKKKLEIWKAQPFSKLTTIPTYISSTIPNAEIETFIMLPDQKSCLIGYDDFVFIKWDLKTLEPLAEFNLHRRTASIAITPDGKRFVANIARGEGVALWAFPEVILEKLSLSEVIILIKLQQNKNIISQNRFYEERFNELYDKLPNGAQRMLEKKYGMPMNSEQSLEPSLKKLKLRKKE